MRKRIAMTAVLACAFSLSVAPVGVIAAQPSNQETVAAETGEEPEDGTTETADGDEGQVEDVNEDNANTNEAGADAENRDPEEPEVDGNEDFADDSSDTGAATETQASENSIVLPAYVKETESTEAEDTDQEIQEDEESQEEGDEAAEDILDAQTYSAPEDEQHVNVSFDFEESASSAYFSELTYPLTLRLQEVDTRHKLTLTIKSEGQILEIEKGDYAVVSLKDSGKVPLTVAGDTLHMYQNMEYPVRFAANNGLKMFMDFIADNILLVGFFVFAALFYKVVVIPRFASDIRRR